MDKITSIFLNLSTGAKIGAGFSSVLILTAALGFVGWNGPRRLCLKGRRDRGGRQALDLPHGSPGMPPTPIAATAPVVNADSTSAAVRTLEGVTSDLDS